MAYYLRQREIESKLIDRLMDGLPDDAEEFARLVAEDIRDGEYHFECGRAALVERYGLAD